MDHFHYQNGALFAEEVDPRALAEQYGTPLYVYSRRTIVEHFNRFQAAFAQLNPKICFAVKSCHNLAILRLFEELGTAFDIVSGGELGRVLAIGADPAKVVFAGVGKTDDEIRAALDAGVGWYNVESESELANLAEIAAAQKRPARVALRINPDVDPHTHAYTTTGKRETKFGIDWDRAEETAVRFRGHPGLCIEGLHVHVGSMVRTVEPYVLAIERACAVAQRLQARDITIKTVNLGGGFGAHYDGPEALPLTAYADRMIPMLRNRGFDILFEPGRMLVANAGILLTRVLYTKSSGKRRFAVVDAGMTDLIRPALYGAFHFIWPVEAKNGLIPPQRSADLQLPGCTPFDVVGPVCETSDFLGKDRWLPPLSRGDLLCVFTVGAYGSVMGSQYNSRRRAAEVLVDGSGARLIRRRDTFADLVACEMV